MCPGICFSGWTRGQAGIRCGPRTEVFEFFFVRGVPRWLLAWVDKQGKTGRGTPPAGRLWEVQRRRTRDRSCVHERRPPPPPKTAVSAAKSFDQLLYVENNNNSSMQPRFTHPSMSFRPHFARPPHPPHTAVVIALPSGSMYLQQYIAPIRPLMSKTIISRLK